MKLIVIVVLLWCVCSSQDDPYPEFRAIEQDEFGKTLIDTLEIHLQTSEPLGRFLEIMRDMESQIEREQSDDDTKHKSFVSKCDKDLDDQETQFNVQSRRNVELQSIADELKNEQLRRSSALDVKVKWLSQLKDKVAEMDRNRQDETKLFEQEIEENQYIISVVEGVKRVFSNDQDGDSFLQTQTSSQQLQKVVQSLDEAQLHADQFTRNRSFKSLFMVMSQVASRIKDDQESVTSLLDICKQLMRNAEDTMSLLRKSEDKQQDVFQRQNSALMKSVTQGDNDSAQLTATLMQVVSRIQSNKMDLEDSIIRTNIQQKQIDDRGEECRSDAYFYEQNRNDRNKNRQLVSTVIGLFSANQREFQDYISSGRK